MSDAILVGKLLDKAIGKLVADEADSPGLDARILLGEVMGIEPAKLLVLFNEPVSSEQHRVFSQFLERRLAGEPVHRIIGYRAFYGRDFYFNSDCLEPRPETELLVEKVLDDFKTESGARFLDIGSGSGVICTTLLCERPGFAGVAADIALGALEATRKNAILHNVADRLELTHSNYLDEVDGKFDFIVSNPPYIATEEIQNLSRNVQLFDPVAALDGGADGLEAYRAILAKGGEHLSKGGRLYLETGFDQHKAIKKIAAEMGWLHRFACQDLSGHDRILVLARSTL